METLVRIEHLKKYFPIRKASFWNKSFVRAVDDVSFDIRRGDTMALVGESGCGKSTVGKTIMRLIEPSGGNVFIGSKRVFQLDKNELKNIRKEIAMIFQDPYTSLNPRLRVMDIVAEPLKTHTNLKGKELEDKISILLEQVGVGKAHFWRYPHELSGGQRQRISIARALALNPSFLILDEPTSALDVSVQAQVLNLIVDLQKTYHLTYLFISHNLAVVEHISHRVIIMYLGKIVEMGYTKKIFSNPLHPYAKALLSAVPNPDPDRQVEQIMLIGDVPSPVNLPPGCNFHTRCPYAEKQCELDVPFLTKVGKDHYVACTLWPNFV